MVAAPPSTRKWESAEIGRSLSRATIRITQYRQMRVNENSRLIILPSMVRAGSAALELQNAAKTYWAMVVGQVDDARAALARVPRNYPGRVASVGNRVQSFVRKLASKTTR